MSTVATSIEITGNQISALDGAGGCTRAIDLGDRVVIPGMIDNHVHWLARAYRPGHEVAEMDNAFSVADAVAILNQALDRAPAVSGDATADNFLTAIGGITPTQFTEGALPDLTALDAVARPVLLSAGFNGPSSTNTEGRTYLLAQGVTVASDGSISTGIDTSDAIAALAAEQTFEDQTRGVLDLMAWSASVGLTTVVNFSDDSAAAEVLYDDGTAFTRMRHSLGARDSTTAFNQLNDSIDAIIASPIDDFFRSDLIGEFAVRTLDISGNSPLPSNYDEAAALMATSGVGHHQHSIPDAEASDYLGVWEALGNDIADLRWQLAHVFDMSVSSLDRLDAVGGGFAMQSINYTGTFNGSMGPPYRTAVAHGLPVGAGTDGGNLVTINPWLGIYFMTTGLNDAGVQRLPVDETVTVMEAFELYTLGSAWFSFDDAKLGSLEAGKLADLIVLTKDPFELETMGQLADLRDVKSALTVVDGEIVYSDGSVVACEGSDASGVWYRMSAGAECIVVPEPGASVSMLAAIGVLGFLAHVRNRRR
jgi:predicted amidohydrolase YtcJ